MTINELIERLARCAPTARVAVPCMGCGDLAAEPTVIEYEAGLLEYEAGHVSIECGACAKKGGDGDANAS
jgi:hypothetical protein